MKILMVAGDDQFAVSGVRDHAARLSEWLAAAGHEVEPATPAAVPSRGGYDAIHLHYVPFLFAGWGAGAVPLAARLRRLAPLVLSVHEPRIPYGITLRELLLAPLQDLALQVLARGAAAIIVPTSRWRPFLRGPRGARARLVPAGSSLPMDALPAAGDRSGPVRIGLISSGHHSRLHGLAVRAAKAAAAASGGEVIALGQDLSRRGDGLSYSGVLPPEEFARRLACCDLLLLPYSDGVTGRRTSFISALQAGVPVLTTLDRGLQDFGSTEAFAHTPTGDDDGFVAAAGELAADPARRATLARRGRALFEAELSWPVLGAAVLEVYGQAREAAP